MFLAYPFLAVLSVLLAGLTWLFAPLLAKAVQPDGNLPRWCRWAQTFDDNCFALRRPEYGSMQGSDVEVATAWLRRNPGYGFDYWPLGCAFDPAQWRVLVDRPDGSLFIAIGPRGRFNVFGKIGIRFKFGWKASNYWRGDHFSNEPWGPEMRAPICCTVSR